MSLVTAQNLIRRLRSNGIRVYLGAAEEVCFRRLEEAPCSLKKEIMEHGGSIRQQLLAERKVRENRQLMKRK